MTQPGAPESKPFLGGMQLDAVIASGCEPDNKVGPRATDSVKNLIWLHWNFCEKWHG